MTLPDDVTLADVEFDELESVDQYEATFTGSLHGEEITLTFTLESAIAAEESATVYTPGDEELEQVTVQPGTYEFEADDGETVRFTATDDDGQEIAFVYVFAEAEDADANEVGLEVDRNS